MSKERIKGFSIKGTKSSLETPNNCYYCGSDDIVGVEILGALDEPLIWECGHCGEHMLKYDREKTKKLLDKAPELDITKEEWELAWQGKPN